MIITAWQHKIELDVQDRLTVKNMRKIYPIIKEKEGNEMEMVIGIVNALAKDDSTEIIDAMDMDEFTELSQEITKLLEKKK
jgi:hypothetical protein